MTAFSRNTVDTRPISVQTVSIIEADTNRVPIAQSAIDGHLEDGFTFSYTSVAAWGDYSQIPSSIQMSITGLNAEGETLVQVWVLEFTNECSIVPKLKTKDSTGWTDYIGWTQFVSIISLQSSAAQNIHAQLIHVISPSLLLLKTALAPPWRRLGPYACLTHTRRNECQFASQSSSYLPQLCPMPPV